jgi:hypothetical protein
MFKILTVSRIALFFLVMVVATTAVAAEKATPSGKVTIQSTSIAAGIGVTWGDGKLTFKGKEYPFSVDGLTLVDWGISKASANGDVYNLSDPAKLGGTCKDRELPARHEDRRPDLAAGRLRRRRPADADRPRDQSGGRCLGNGQLADHQQLLRRSCRSAVDPLRRPGCDHLLRHGQAGARAADRTGAATVRGGKEVSRRSVE